MRWEAVIGGNLRRLRKAQGLSQEKLAAEVELDMRQLGRIERGESFPSLGTLIRLAEILDVEPAVLLRREFSESAGRSE
ncbi:MAG TPA: helix-turn-helix transcriptional regulator [Caulobacteraceae bacterium]|jgi:transcriptional regulator with XRE-family HTH domain|nr:helix-turn-helix transcriptional regulator [Caulobacteraceae bacterium]